MSKSRGASTKPFVAGFGSVCSPGAAWADLISKSDGCLVRSSATTSAIGRGRPHSGLAGITLSSSMIWSRAVSSLGPLGLMLPQKVTVAWCAAPRPPPQS